MTEQFKIDMVSELKSIAPELIPGYEGTNAQWARVIEERFYGEYASGHLSPMKLETFVKMYFQKYVRAPYYGVKYESLENL